MTTIHSSLRLRYMAAAAAIAIAAGTGLAALSPVAHAEAVRVESAQVAPGFADVVEKVSPAVVSVRVKSNVQPANNDGFSFNIPGMPGLDDLPRDHPLNRFFREFRGDNDRGFRDRREERQGDRRGPKRMRPTW